MQPLAPAPSAREGGRGYLTPPTNMSLPPQRKASMACGECKRLKSKCRVRDGATSCDRCTKQKLQCIFDLDDDGRRRLAHKRKIERLEEERDLLLQVVHSLRDSSDAKAAQLLNLVRSKAPLGELKLYMDQDVTEEDRYELLYAANKKVSLHRAMDINRLVDIPVYRVPAAPWTSVTTSDDLVSHLVSLWFTWSHPFYNWVDRDLFLRDARSGKLDSPFCSPFLFNCILAEACFHSEYPEAYADPDDPNSKGTHFYEEARRHYEKVEGQLDVPTLQGSGVMYVCMAAMGKDRVGWWYLSQINDMAQEYSKRHRPPSVETRESRAVNNTIWGLYCLTATASIGYMKYLAIEQPERPLLSCDHAEDDTWSPYPQPQATPLQSHIPCVFNNWCELSKINMDINKSIFGTGSVLPRGDLHRTLQEVQPRLDDWRAQLPECLTLENSSVPQAFSLHFFYHTLIIMLWGLLKGEANPDDADEDDDDESDRAATAATARGLCVDSALAIVRLLRIHRTRWGIDYIHPTTIHWVSMALFTLLEVLDHPVPEYKTSFTELCVCARALSRKWILMKGILRMIQVSAQKNSVVLPPETDALFTEFEQVMWESKDRERFKSLYPNPNSLSKTAGDRSQLDDAELDSFLEKWDTLHVDEDGEREESADSEQV
ncbi:hypothetical protein ASPACDRAFT_80335 [Aspergillus aculeatus ATCC 16872]|uniref:Zn(2)-C6 fungal-type domain-containing protein n=1 Tax=Aspergillus aculeatus (strain ATCC 16872 / CBS 172.66 / WB 5094) TaxID=690307 RepID=A0A1L9WMS8_ASPA1|nr:uncharacterized protein ASPACDRAFT_80335 [Aspergillus aculeatus ATCC 16872]OJJ97427.1 hypothetical protein ASPACDRAFT_80335 [Aspergillus aculeatus ATCC 16872]